MPHYIRPLYEFLDELGRRQDRDWFKANRSRYDELRALWMADIDRLIDNIEPWWPQVKGQTARSSVYRIYRDTRFSPDKRPFKNYFSAAVSPRSRSAANAHMPGYYLQMGPAGGDWAVDNGLYGGIWQPDSATLKKLRKAIIDNIEEFEEIINNPAMTAIYTDWCGDRLKTVPKGYDRNHPQAHLLRLKDFGRFAPRGIEYFDDPAWPEKVADDFRPLKPLLDFLEYSINEEV
ncbi:MAG: DUF2461 domain-containing protein [Muribaculaceae bacterium]|nr:DUF2461 domain-containing protein [Muribaculaceae bacterium]